MTFSLDQEITRMRAFGFLKVEVSIYEFFLNKDIGTELMGFPIFSERRPPTQTHRGRDTFGEEGKAGKPGKGGRGLNPKTSAEVYVFRRKKGPCQAIATAHGRL